MRSTEIIEALRSKLTVPVGRHLYGVLGTYAALDAFAAALRDAKTPDGQRFPAPLNVNRGILAALPAERFQQLAQDEVIYPEPTVATIADAFERFLRHALREPGLVALAHLELLFAYYLDLSPLRTLAADDRRILLLLPGRRMGEKTLLFDESGDQQRVLPINLIAENHVWEIK